MFVRIGRRGLSGTNPQAYNEHLSIMDVKNENVDTMGQCYKTIYGRNL